MKFFLSILLSSVVLVQSLSKTIIAFEFNLNQKVIAEQLCVNKSKPMMHCNGSCFLKKKLNEDEKRQSPTNTSVKEKFEVQFTEEKRPQIMAGSDNSEMLNILFTENYSFSYHPPIFHPPLV